MSWACDALDCTAAKANPGNKSPYEMWYGSPPLAGEVWPFLKPAIYRVNRENKSQPKAQDCYYVGPSVNHPRVCMRVLTSHRTILTTRNVTWQNVPRAPTAPQQHLPPSAEGGESTAGEGASGEGASSQGGGRVADLDSESELDMTGVGPVLPARRKASAAEAGAGIGGAAEGNPPAPLAPFRRAKSAMSTSAATSAGAATAATPKMKAPGRGAATVTPATPAMSATVQAAASATGTVPRSQRRRRDVCSISVSPPNSRADARGPNHGAGL